MKQRGPHKKRYPMWTSIEVTPYKDAEYIWHDYQPTKGQTPQPTPSPSPPKTESFSDLLHVLPFVSSLVALAEDTETLHAIASCVRHLHLFTQTHSITCGDGLGFMYTKPVYVICTCSHKYTPLQVILYKGTCIGNACTSSAPVHTNTLHYR